MKADDELLDDAVSLYNYHSGKANTYKSVIKVMNPDFFKHKKVEGIREPDIEENETDLSPDPQPSIQEMESFIFNCTECGNLFVPKNINSRFCCEKCKKKWTMRKYWQTHKVVDGHVVKKDSVVIEKQAVVEKGIPVSGDHVKELLEKCKKTGIPPIPEPDLKNRNL